MQQVIIVCVSIVWRQLFFLFYLNYISIKSQSPTFWLPQMKNKVVFIIQVFLYQMIVCTINGVYRIVASRSTSRLVTCFGLFRLLMKGIFGPYVLWPLDKKLIFWIVTRVSARDYTVCILIKLFQAWSFCHVLLRGAS